MWSSAYPAPVERARQIVAGAERQNGDRRRRVDAEAVDRRQYPADRAVAAARQQPQVRHLTKHLQPTQVIITRLLVSVLFLLSISFPQLAAFCQQFITEMCFF